MKIHWTFWLVLLSCVVTFDHGSHAQTSAPTVGSAEDSRGASSVPTTRVTLTIDLGDGYLVSYNSLAWIEGQTVLDAMQLAAKHRQPLKFSHRGAAETAFLTSLCGYDNEGAGGKNWIFKVNGKLARQSFAITHLAAGDTVSWHFLAGNPSATRDSVP